jgi:hypothetical protein
LFFLIVHGINRCVEQRMHTPPPATPGKTSHQPKHSGGAWLPQTPCSLEIMTVCWQVRRELLQTGYREPRSLLGVWGRSPHTSVADSEKF